MNIREIQEQVTHWARANFADKPDGTVDYHKPFMGLVEEVGELSHALLKQEQGIRGPFAEHEDEAKDAVGDIMIYLFHLCGERGWDLEDIVVDTWNKVSKRDWKSNPVNGGES